MNSVLSMYFAMKLSKDRKITPINIGKQPQRIHRLHQMEKVHAVMNWIRIPENITDGDYYYSLLAETTPPTASEWIGSARVKATIGSNILVTISNSGNIDIKPRVVLFSTRGGSIFGQDWKIFDSSDKIPLVFIVENKGKNMIKPEGQITLKGNFGETAKYDIISKNILA